MRAADRVTLRKKVVEWMFPSRFTTYSLPPRPIQFQLGPILSAFFSSFPPFIQRSPETFPPLRSLPSPPSQLFQGQRAPPPHQPFPPSNCTPPHSSSTATTILLPRPPLWLETQLFTNHTTSPPRDIAAGSSLPFHYVVDKARYVHGPARYTGYAHGMGVGRPTNIGRVRG